LELIPLHVRSVVHGSEKAVSRCRLVYSLIGRRSCWQPSLRHELNTDWIQKNCKQFTERQAKELNLGFVP